MLGSCLKIIFQTHLSMSKKLTKGRQKQKNNHCISNNRRIKIMSIIVGLIVLLTALILVHILSPHTKNSKIYTENKKSATSKQTTTVQSVKKAKQEEITGFGEDLYIYSDYINTFNTLFIKIRNFVGTIKSEQVLSALKKENETYYEYFKDFMTYTTSTTIAIIPNYGKENKIHFEKIIYKVFKLIHLIYEFTNSITNEEIEQNVVVNNAIVYIGINTVTFVYLQFFMRHSAKLLETSIVIKENAFTDKMSKFILLTHLQVVNGLFSTKFIKEDLYGKTNEFEVLLVKDKDWAKTFLELSFYPLAYAMFNYDEQTKQVELKEIYMEYLMSVCSEESKNKKNDIYDRIRNEYSKCRDIYKVYDENMDMKGKMRHGTFKNCIEGIIESLEIVNDFE
eukprot:GAHX01005039.1.p1 GENE.GAHX01005039.1~~GAHX01005039.1.p1  ORF type:complete len:394 (+),score=66.36 GAHX01005039.1:111-1292(+)